jgi:hypothetical protein
VKVGYDAGLASIDEIKAIIKEAAHRSAMTAAPPALAGGSTIR